MGQLEEIYTKEWFEKDFAELRPEFNVVADAIFRQFKPKYVVDYGCGPGMLIERLSEFGVETVGFEGSKHGIDYARDAIRARIDHKDILDIPRDIALQPAKFAVHCLVVCTEVAEHLDAKDADHLVNVICSNLCPVIFTAAPPGQDGHHHVNCQPMHYWIEKFRAHGLIPDHKATEQLQLRWSGLKRLSHMPKNLMVFV